MTNINDGSIWMLQGGTKVKVEKLLYRVTRRAPHIVGRITFGNVGKAPIDEFDILLETGGGIIVLKNACLCTTSSTDIVATSFLFTAEEMIPSFREDADPFAISYGKNPSAKRLKEGLRQLEYDFSNIRHVMPDKPRTEGD